MSQPASIPFLKVCTSYYAPVVYGWSFIKIITDKWTHKTCTPQIGVITAFAVSSSLNFCICIMNITVPLNQILHFVAFIWLLCYICLLQKWRESSTEKYTQTFRTHIHTQKIWDLRFGSYKYNKNFLFLGKWINISKILYSTYEVLQRQLTSLFRVLNCQTLFHSYPHL